MTPQSHGSAFVKALCKATWNNRVCLFKPLRTACCVPSVRSVPAFTALTSTGHESFLSTWRHPRTWPKTTKYTEPEAWPWLLRVCRVITPFPSCTEASPPLSFCSPMPLGCRLGKVSRCDWNTEPHSEEKATGQRGAKDLHCVHIFTVCQNLQPYPTQSRFRTENSSTFNRTVRCLQSRLVFRGKPDLNERQVIPWIRPHKKSW